MVWFCPPPSGPGSLQPMVSPLIPVGGPDQERIGFYLEQLVAIGRSGGNSAKNIGKIRIENRPLPDAPPAEDSKE